MPGLYFIGEVRRRHRLARRLQFPVGLGQRLGRRAGRLSQAHGGAGTGSQTLARCRVVLPSGLGWHRPTDPVTCQQCCRFAIATHPSPAQGGADMLICLTALRRSCGETLSRPGAWRRFLRLLVSFAALVRGVTFAFWDRQRVCAGQHHGPIQNRPQRQAYRKVLGFTLPPLAHQPVRTRCHLRRLPGWRRCSTC